MPIGSARVHGDGTDLTLVTFGNGLRPVPAGRPALAAGGIACRVVDLRWLAPLPVDDCCARRRRPGGCSSSTRPGHSGGVGEGVVTALVEGGFAGRIARVASADCFIPLGAAANLVLVSEDEIVAAARAIVTRR